MMHKAVLLSVGILAAGSNFARAQTPPPAQAPAPHDVGELAKKTQNPAADLVSVPFQFNFNTGGDLGDATFFSLGLRIEARSLFCARTTSPPNDAASAPSQTTGMVQADYREQAGGISRP